MASLALGGLAWLGLAALMLWSVLPQDNWQTLISALDGRAGLIVLLWLLTLLPLSMALKRFIDRHVHDASRLAEQARAVLDHDQHLDVTAWSSPDHRRLSLIINQLVDQRRAVLGEMDQRVLDATRTSELERSRLSALMAELDKSVVVCNLDGRILLYNRRARLQFKRLSRAPGVTQGAELIGLGRSIHTVIDRELIEHALDKVRRRLKRGATHPASQFVTGTASGKLFRAQVSPVCELDKSGQRDPAQLNGYVLLLENITADIKAHEDKDRLLRTLTEDARIALASSRAALNELTGPPSDDIDPSTRLEQLRNNIDTLCQHLDRAAAVALPRQSSHWPLEDMLADEWLEVTAEHLRGATGSDVVVEFAEAPIWLRLDSHALTRSVVDLGNRLAESAGDSGFELRIERRDGQALIDVSLPWPASSPLPEIKDWLDSPVSQTTGLPTMNPRDMLRRHSGECWMDRVGPERAALRLLLPIIEPRDELPGLATGERPMFFDFDLFQAQSAEQTLADRRLNELTYTVFDLETTGLNPAAGDEIIQVGAVRVVNGRILDQEHFDQLVDPGRPIPILSTRIHGITPEHVQDQPRLNEVLPAFHAYCHDSVLVAHNAAFDMRCLTIKQDSLGLSFDHPVLDTLLLASLVQPNQHSHGLDALAERFGLTNSGRHTALGDARVTAELLVRLIPLLADLGITTLGQAMEASRQSHLAHIQY